MIALPRLAAGAIPVAALALVACNSAPSQGSSSPAPHASAAATVRDWPRFGYDAAATGHAPHGLSAARVGKLKEKRVRIDGTVDSSPIMVRRTLVVTTTYGRTLGLDPASGKVRWRFVPSSYNRVKGSSQITNATPVADPGRRYVYAASPDGRIHKLSVKSGHEARGWPVAITKDATHEKITSSLNVQGRYVLATMGGYLGDAPPYQGKVVAINRRRHRIAHVFNSLCSNRRRVIRPSSCSSVESAIWGRAGAVVDPHTHKIYVTSSNGPFDGVTDWGDSVLELSAGAGKLLRHYTPANQRQLAATDADLGSTHPALLPDPASGVATHLLQGGKDGKLRVLSLATSLKGVSGAAGKSLGGEVQTLPLPGDGSRMFTAPAVLHRKGSTTVFVATDDGTVAYRFAGGRLQRIWGNGTGGTSPVIAGGLVLVYDPDGGLVAYRPNTGTVVRRMSAPSGHWNSPIVTGGRVYLPTGNANDHATSGELSIYR